PAFRLHPALEGGRHLASVLAGMGLERPPYLLILTHADGRTTAELREHDLACAVTGGRHKRDQREHRNGKQQPRSAAVLGDPAVDQHRLGERRRHVLRRREANGYITRRGFFHREERRRLELEQTCK